MIIIVSRNRVFRFFSQMLKGELINLGYECEICVENLAKEECLVSNNNIYILVGPQLFNQNEIDRIKKAQAKIIGISTEGLHYFQKPKKHTLLGRLNICDVIWVHEKADMDLIKKVTGKSDVYYFPLGFSRHYQLTDDLEKFSKPQKNIIYLGHLGNSRRAETWRNLKRAESITTCWDNKSYKKLFKENYLFLNLGYPGLTCYGAPFRLMPLISNNTLIISQRFDDNDLNRLVIHCDSDSELNETINYYLKNPEKAKEKSHEISEWAKNNFSVNQNLIKFGCKNSIDKLIANPI
tara:strand:- start:7133 stop:8014 length:882 start_codon:yes stop_codon:yes gene_type:complete